jgi:hypothetical protein
MRSRLVSLYMNLQDLFYYPNDDILLDHRLRLYHLHIGFRRNLIKKTHRNFLLIKKQYYYHHHPRKSIIKPPKLSVSS